ncbi:hypothetical protein B0H17DRAFT_1100180 [Mycena rosella]|uniref:GATA-type domain-containing protein n=1 Tax=Mycena rosella TaxID=1033263 RepID=A0AAD7CN36_MYCRO|nr:hypothetical protein B0H17DRAFT_1100180 [Mycena rosella]
MSSTRLSVQWMNELSTSAPSFPSRVSLFLLSASASPRVCRACGTVCPGMTGLRASSAVRTSASGFWFLLLVLLVHRGACATIAVSVFVSGTHVRPADAPPRRDVPHVDPSPARAAPVPRPSSGPAPPPAKHRRPPYERRASPPPIATLPTHSGSPSPSPAVSTPPLPPPHHHPGYAYDMPRGSGAGGYIHAPPPPPQYHDERYAPHPHAPHPHAPHPHDPDAHGPFPIQHAGYVPYPLPGTILSAPMAPPQNGQQQQGGVVQVVHTDDAATKLSDRLCNKCGLFERTHSRPRPEQLPHKRGPLASSTLRSRSPPGSQPQQPAYAQPHYAPRQSSPYIAPLASSASAPPSAASANPPSHPGTPNPQQANGNAQANGRASAMRARAGGPPAAGEEKRSASPRERDEWREERSERRGSGGGSGGARTSR